MSTPEDSPLIAIEPRGLPALRVNQPVASLSPAETLVVNGVRVWVRAIKSQDCPAAAVLASLTTVDLVDAATPLHHLMCFVGSHSRIAMDVRCPKCTHLGDGERRLIGLLAAAQGGDDTGFTRQAAEIFNADVLIGAAVVARRVASQYLAKGLSFPARPVTPEGLAVPMHPADSASHQHPASATVH